MRYRKVSLVYHIVVRRIEDKLLFKDIYDYYRGITVELPWNFSVYEFNNAKSVRILKRRQAI